MTAPVADPDTLVALLDRRADDDTTGLVVDDASWTWRAVVAESARWSAALATAAPGDRPVPRRACCSATGPSTCSPSSAPRAIGAVLVGINETRRGEELARDIRHTDCVIVLTDAEHVPLLAGLDLGDAPRWSTSPATRGANLVATAPDADLPAVHAADVLLLIFTSGSTGAPKAVQLSHGRACRVAERRRVVRPRRRPLLRDAAVPRQRAQRRRLPRARHRRHDRTARAVLGVAVHARRPPLRRDVLQHRGPRARVHPRDPGRRPRTATTT